MIVNREQTSSLIHGQQLEGECCFFDALITSPTNLKALVLEFKQKTTNEKSVIIMQKREEHF